MLATRMRMASGEKILYPDTVYYGSAYDDYWEVGVSQRAGSQNMAADHLYMQGDYDGGTSSRSYVTKNTIDLTGYSTLKVQWLSEGGTGDIRNYCNVRTAANKSAVSYINNVVEIRVNNAFTLTTSSGDISAVSGAHHIIVSAVSNQSGQSAKLKVYKVWLE